MWLDGRTHFKRFGTYLDVVFYTHGSVNATTFSFIVALLFGFFNVGCLLERVTGEEIPLTLVFTQGIEGSWYGGSRRRLQHALFECENG